MIISSKSSKRFQIEVVEKGNLPDFFGRSLLTTMESFKIMPEFRCTSRLGSEDGPWHCSLGTAHTSRHYAYFDHLIKPRQTPMKEWEWDDPEELE